MISSLLSGQDSNIAQELPQRRCQGSALQCDLVSPLLLKITPWDIYSSHSSQPRLHHVTAHHSLETNLCTQNSAPLANPRRQDPSFWQKFLIALKASDARPPCHQICSDICTWGSFSSFWDVVLFFSTLAMLLKSLPVHISLAQAACAGADVKHSPQDPPWRFSLPWARPSSSFPTTFPSPRAGDQVEVSSWHIWVTPHPNFGPPRAASSTSCICLWVSHTGNSLKTSLRLDRS